MNPANPRPARIAAAAAARFVAGSRAARPQAGHSHAQLSIAVGYAKFIRSAPVFMHAVPKVNFFSPSGKVSATV
jgi:hypothetical protein